MSKKNNNLREDINRLSQLDGQQVLKDIHSLPGRYARVSDARVLVPQYFDDVGIDYNSDGKVTEARYYVGTEPHITEIATVDDVAGSLQDSYIAISAGRLKERYVLHFTIDGVGSPPVLSGVKFVEVPLQSGDSAALIASAIKAALSTYEQFSISQVSNNLIIKTKALGITSNTVQVGTGFTVTNTSGARELVQVVNLEYSVDGYPVWQGQELKDIKYNPYTTKFESSASSTKYLKAMSESSTPSIDEGNSTSTPLLSGEVFYGSWTNRTSPEVLIAPSADQDFDYYLQYANEMLDDALPYTAGLSDGIIASVMYTFDSDITPPIPRRLILSRPVYRVVAVNTSGNDMSEFALVTSTGSFNEPVVRLTDPVQGDADAVVVRSVSTGQNPEGDFVNEQASGVSIGNTTSTLLGTGGTFIGEWEDVRAYSSISIIINSDQDSATGGAIAEFSNDGATIIRQLSANFLANPNGAYFSIPVEARYFRMNYTNGSTPQSKFFIETLLSKNPNGLTTIPLNSTVDDLSSTLVTRSVNVGKTPSGEYRNEKISGIDPNNSTSDVLSAGETYTGTWTDVSSYSTAGVTLFSDELSAEDGILFELSTDGVNVDESDKFTFPGAGSGNTGKVYSFPLFAKYFRVRYVNGPVDQTEFRLQTKLFKETLKPSNHRINDSVIDQDDAELVKAVLSGEDPEGVFRNIKSSGDGNLLVAIGQRPSQVLNRVRVSGNVEYLSIDSAGTTLHTVTPGYVFYITSVIISATNTASSVGRFGFYDGSNLVIPFILPDRISGSSPSGTITTSPNLPEPIRITDSFRIVEIAGTISASVAFVGYEEPLAFQNLSSLSFDGVNEYINLATPASLNLSSNFSISAWFNTTNTANNKCIIGKYGSSAAERSYFIELVGSSNVVRVYLYGAGGLVKDYRTPLSYNDGLWHNVTITFAANDLKIYMDGVAIIPTVVTDATVLNLQSNSSDTKIAALPLTGSQTNYFNGKLDEVSIYNSVLTSSEVLELYNSGDPIELSTSSFSSKLLSWYRMGDGTTLPDIIDVAPGGNDGTAVNMESGDIQNDVP